MNPNERAMTVMGLITKLKQHCAVTASVYVTASSSSQTFQITDVQDYGSEVTLIAPELRNEREESEIQRDAVEDAVTLFSQTFNAGTLSFDTGELIYKVDGHMDNRIVMHELVEMLYTGDVSPITDDYDNAPPQPPSQAITQPERPPVQVTPIDPEPTTLQTIRALEKRVVELNKELESVMENRRTANNLVTILRMKLNKQRKKAKAFKKQYNALLRSVVKLTKRKKKKHKKSKPAAKK